MPGPYPLGARLWPCSLLGSLALSLGVLALGGCILFDEPEPEQQEDPTAGVDPAAYAEQIDAKLRRHSECRDTVASVLGESWDRYTDQVDEDGKPKRRREGVFVHGIGSNTFRGCRRVIAAYATDIEMVLIEQSMIELVDAGSRYAALTRQLDTYLEAEAWKDDGWAKLTELDLPLRAAHAEWAAADAILQQALDFRHIENDQLLLGALAQRASPLEFASRRVMIHARPLVRCLEVEPTPPIERCRALFEVFDQVEGEFEDTYAADSNADKVFWMSTFASDVEEFHEVTADLVRALDQRSFRTSDLQGMRDAYSSLARDAETLDFDFP